MCDVLDEMREFSHFLHRELLYRCGAMVHEYTLNDLKSQRRSIQKLTE